MGTPLSKFLGRHDDIERLFELDTYVGLLLNHTIESN